MRVMQNLGAWRRARGADFPSISLELKFHGVCQKNHDVLTNHLLAEKSDEN